MRRLATPLLMAAVAAVGIAALVDAVRGREAPNPRAEAVSELREAGLRGRLVYANARCRLRALSLPDLQAARPPRGPSFACTFSVSPDGRRVVQGDAAWDPSSFEYARCGRFGVDVRRPGLGFGLNFSGCAPAFRPGGFLTIARDEGFVEVRATCPAPPCERVLLGRDDLLAAAAQHPNVPVSLALVVIDIADVEWLSHTRVALLVELRFLGRLEALGPQQLIALYQGKRLVFAQPLLFGPEIERLEAAPRGRYFAAEPNLLLRWDGSQAHLPRLADPHSLAWSPDGRWLAIATRASVYLFEIEGRGRLVRVPLVARDLAWR
jgi:hypothetical protein